MTIFGIFSNVCVLYHFIIGQNCVVQATCESYGPEWSIKSLIIQKQLVIMSYVIKRLRCIVYLGMSDAE